MTFRLPVKEDMQELHQLILSGHGDCIPDNLHTYCGRHVEDNGTYVDEFRIVHHGDSDEFWLCGFRAHNESTWSYGHFFIKPRDAKNKKSKFKWGQKTLLEQSHEPWRRTKLPKDKQSFELLRKYLTVISIAAQTARKNKQAQEAKITAALDSFLEDTDTKPSLLAGLAITSKH